MKTNLSQIMKMAWTLARQGAEKFGGKARNYFAESLKIAWKESRTVDKSWSYDFKMVAGGFLYPITLKAVKEEAPVRKRRRTHAEKELDEKFAENRRLRIIELKKVCAERGVDYDEMVNLAREVNIYNNCVDEDTDKTWRNEANTFKLIKKCRYTMIDTDELERKIYDNNYFRHGGFDGTRDWMEQMIKNA